VIFSACAKKTEREKDEAETKDCLKEKSENEKYKTIEEAIGNFDFVVARKYLGCFPNTGYSLAYKSNSFFKEDRPGGDRNNGSENNKYKENLLTIVRAEIAYWLKNENFTRAKNVAVESGLIEELVIILPDHISGLLEKKQYDKVFPILLSWKFKYDFFESREPDYEYDKEFYRDNPHANTFYNEEVQTYNDIVDNVFNSALINNETVVMKKCLSMYVPIAVANPKESEKVKSILRNDSRSAAVKKMIEQGVSLK
jgi:hypothetical protein